MKSKFPMIRLAYLAANQNCGKMKRAICEVSPKVIQNRIKNFDVKEYKYLRTDPFQVQKEPLNEKFEILHDNSTIKEVLRNSDRKYVFFGHYRNVLTIYDSLKEALSPRISESDIYSKYFKVREQRRQLSERINQIYFTANQDGIDYVKGAPQTDLLKKLVQRSDSSQVLVPLHTFLTGIKSMDQWLHSGILIEALKERITPSFGVFSPTNQVYLNLFDQSLRKYGKTKGSMLDIGSGTGVLSYIASRRGFSQIDATDINPWAIECIQDNINKLKITNVTPHLCDSFPSIKKHYDVIVFNPPWVSVDQQGSTLDLAVFDHQNKFYNYVMQTSKEYLKPNGIMILIYSNLSRLLKISPNEPHFGEFKVLEKLTATKKGNPSDPFYDIKKLEEIQCFILKV